MLVSISVAGVYLVAMRSSRPSWNRSMALFFATQCEGFSESPKIGDFHVVLRDFSELEDLNVDERLTREFVVSNGIFIDKKNAFAIKDEGDTLRLWHGGGFSISIPYLLQLAFIRINRSFIHSAAVSYGSKAFIFPAFGGVGKTLLVSQIVTQSGFQLLGDDLCVVRKDGAATAYARPFCLYEHHKEALGPVFRRFGINHFWPNLAGRALRKFRDFSYVHMGIDFPKNRYCGIRDDYVLASPISIYGPEKICTEFLPIGAVVLLRRRPQAKKITVEDCTPEEAAQFSVNVTLHEWKEELPPALAYSAVNNKTSAYDKSSMIVRDAFSAAEKTLVLSLPEEIDVKEYVSVVSDILRS